MGSVTHARQLGGRSFCEEVTSGFTDFRPTCPRCRAELRKVGLEVGLPRFRRPRARAREMPAGYLHAVRILNDWAARRVRGA